LQRGTALGHPSGEAIAREMGVELLSADECGPEKNGWTGETPLWYYVLKEAEVRAGGEHLGPVGGLLDADPGAYKRTEPSWHPTPPASRPGDFTMADLLAFAGVA
jgi:hypothetical protein